MMIHKIIPSVYYNYWLKRLDTQRNETTNKFNEPSNKRTLGTSVVNSAMSPPSLHYISMDAGL